MKDSYDVVIIGGGPAGSTLGSYLAKEGVSCAIFEKEIFPRPHVGESLVPSVNLVFKELNLHSKLEEAGFERKYGAIWTSEKSNKVFGHDFEDLDENYQLDIQFKERQHEGVNLNYSYHVDRATFDNILLDHSKELGCNVFEGHQVTGIDIQENCVETKIRDTEGTNHLIQSKLIIDASGRSTFIGTKLKWKVPDPNFNQYAVHTWFKGVERSDKENDNTAIHFLPISNSWVWQIPIDKNTTSIGLVAQKEHFIKGKSDIDKFFWDMIESRPEFYEKLKAASQINEFKVEGDYSYSMKKLTDDRMLLIGDASRFVDPIFSSGINIAIQSSRFAAKDILKALQKNSFAVEEFTEYEKIVSRGSKNWHDFITLYYRLNVMFTYFVNKPEYRIDVLKFLQGDVYDEDEPLLITTMKKFVEGIENNPKHPLHEHLQTLTDNKFS